MAKTILDWRSEARRGVLKRSTIKRLHTQGRITDAERDELDQLLAECEQEAQRAGGVERLRQYWEGLREQTYLGLVDKWRAFRLKAADADTAVGPEGQRIIKFAQREVVDPQTGAVYTTSRVETDGWKIADFLEHQRRMQRLPLEEAAEAMRGWSSEDWRAAGKVRQHVSTIAANTTKIHTFEFDARDQASMCKDFLGGPDSVEREGIQCAYYVLVYYIKFLLSMKKFLNMIYDGARLEREDIQKAADTWDLFRQGISLRDFLTAGLSPESASLALNIWTEGTEEQQEWGAWVLRMRQELAQVMTESGLLERGPDLPDLFTDEWLNQPLYLIAESLIYYQKDTAEKRRQTTSSSIGGLVVDLPGEIGDTPVFETLAATVATFLLLGVPYALFGEAIGSFIRWLIVPVFGGAFLLAWWKKREWLLR